MKVFRVLIIAVLALLMAAPAFAINVKLKADFREFFRVSNQLTLAGGDIDTTKLENDSDFRYAQRLRLTWVMEDDEKKVRGTFGAEFDMVAGEGSSSGATRNGPGGNFEGDRTNFELMLANIDFELPFDPATRLYMGLMSAEMNAFVFCDTAMGVRAARSMGNWDASIGWFRNDADGSGGFGGDAKSDYADLYTLDLQYDFQEGNKLAGFAYYIDDGQDVNFVQSNDNLGGTGAGVLDEADTSNSAQVYWLGLSGAFERGNFFGGATGIYQGGQVGDDDVSAYLFNVEGAVKIDKAYVQLGYLYMSGDDSNDGDIDNYFGIDIDNSLIGSVALLEKYDWNASFYGPNIGRLGASHVYLNAGYEFNEKTDGRLGFIWFNTAEDVPTTSDSCVGYEFNGQIDHSITENLTIGLAAGYLIGDDVWDDLASDDDGDDLWNVITRVRFKF